MPTLPNGFVPSSSSYSFDEPGGVMRTDVDGGMPRYALDWDRGVQRFKITLVLDLMEFSVWTAFYHFQIAKGAIAFDMPLDSGFGVELHTVNIKPGSYSAARTGGALMVVSFIAETENHVYLMDSVGAGRLVDLFNTYGDQSNLLLARIARFATVESNVL